MKFADYFKGGTETAAGLLAAAERAEAEGEAIATRLSELTQRRAAALIADDDRALDRIEAELVRAQRDADRADLAAAELRRRHVEAVERERLAAIEAAHERGLAAQREAVDLIRKRYSKLAAPLVELALKLDQLSDEIEGANRLLVAAADQRQVEHFEHIVRPRLCDAHRVRPGFLRELCLPSPDSVRAGLYPPWDERLLEKAA